MHRLVMQAHFTGLEDRLIAENGLVYLTQRAGAAWLSIRLDFLGLFVLTAAGVLAVGLEINPALAGLSLTYALQLTQCAPCDSPCLSFGTLPAWVRRRPGAPHAPRIDPMSVVRGAGT